MKVGLRFLGLIVFACLAACGPAAGPGTQNSDAAQDAQIAKLEADAELARAQAAKMQAETAKLEDEARIRVAGLETDLEFEKAKAESRRRTLEAVTNPDAELQDNPSPF
jgi:hypothetical protein